MSDAERSASALQPLPSNREAFAVDRDQCMCRVSWVTTTQHWLCTSNRAGVRGSQLLRLLLAVSSWWQADPSAESRPTVQAHCSGVETDVYVLRLVCDTRGLSPDAVGADARRSRLGPPVAEISTELDLSHGESEPFRAHWQASLVTSSDFVGCERDFVGVNVTS